MIPVHMPAMVPAQTASNPLVTARRENLTAGHRAPAITLHCCMAIISRCAGLDDGCNKRVQGIERSQSTQEWSSNLVDKLTAKHNIARSESILPSDQAILLDN